MKRIFRIVGVRSKPSYGLGGWTTPLLIVISMLAVVSAMGFVPGWRSASDPAEAVLVSTDDAGGGPPDGKTKAEQELQEFKKNVSAMVEKMKAEGKSDEEIKRFIKEAEKKFEASRKVADLKAEMETVYRKESKALIAAMQADGKSKEEISKALEKLKKGIEIKFKEREAAEVDPEIAFKKRVMTVVAQMKEMGKSEDEIARYVKKQEAIFQAEMRQKEKQKKEIEFEKKLSAMVEKLRAEGKSDKEIQRVVEEMKTKFKAGEAKVL